MISYEIYKILHISTLFIVIALLGALLSQGLLIQKKSFRISIGVISFLAFVAGMGLIARLGFKHTEPFPLWIWVKMSCWLGLNALIFFIFKSQNNKLKFAMAWASGGVILLAIYAAVTKLA